MLRPIFLVLILLVAGCTSSSVKPVDDAAPTDLIPHDKMVHLLVDVHLLEAAITVRTGKAITENKPTDPMPYYDIMKKHGVTYEQYQRSFKYYSLHLDEFNRIYDEVLSEITQIQVREAKKK